MIFNSDEFQPPHHCSIPSPKLLSLRSSYIFESTPKFLASRFLNLILAAQFHNDFLVLTCPYTPGWLHSYCTIQGQQMFSAENVSSFPMSFGHNYSAMPLQHKCYHRQYSKEWVWLWYNGPQAVFCQPLRTWSITYITLIVCPLFFLCKTPTLNLSNYQIFYG